MLAIMIAQIAVFIAWPSPDTVEGFFALFQDNWLLGLLSLDLLYLFNNALIIPIYLALYMALKRNHESAMLIALVIGLVGNHGLLRIEHHIRDAHHQPSVRIRKR